MKHVVLAHALSLMIAISPAPALAMKAIAVPDLKILTGQAGMSDEAQTTVYLSPITNGRTAEIMQVHWDGGITDVLSYTGVKLSDDMVSTILQSLSGAMGGTSSDLASAYGETSVESQTVTGVSYKYVNTINPETGVEDLFTTRYMTITPGRCPNLSDMLKHNNRVFNMGLAFTTVNGIVITLPTIEIHATAEIYDVGLPNTSDASNSDKKYLKFSRGPTTQATLGGVIEVMTRE